MNSEVGRIQVIGRLRPLNDSEKAKDGENRVVSAIDEQTILVTGFDGYNTIDRRFLLDAVLPENADQEAAFNYVLPLLESTFDGYNCTMFTCKSIF